MRQPKTRVYCEECEDWVSLGPDQERVLCDCGNQYVVTVTTIPMPHQ